MRTKILIAEDEPLMRERLLDLLQRSWPDAEVVAAAENGNDAWDAFLEFEPQVVFLDIRMPGFSGLEVAARIGTAAHVVFVTAYDQYAVDAFEAGAVDYLLKPIEADRLAKAIARIRQKLATPPADLSELLSRLTTAAPTPEREKLKWLKATVGKQIKLIKVEDVLFFQSDTKYTRVVLADSEALIRTPLKDLLAGLDSELFWQIHRGTLVNVHAIAAAERLDAERMVVLLKGSEERLGVSRAFTYRFRE
ncbi:response regulator transcription factor [Chitinimonas arctica]|uniref:Response regulator transcription factor n=1 Tax=Chitinimonas arctica TaxID=2594795 RepID=A0A516SKW6_9NEIS|nr:LytTR family DNA-binding domain-containing protein [Chitinimonas arctica]QDQ28802.1 response regulator transcription factor [Chitinimonas arctica]